MHIGELVCLILLIIFAVVGIVETVRWLERWALPKGGKGVKLVIPVRDHDDSLEMTVRWAQHILRWEGVQDCEVILADYGADPETLALCEEICRSNSQIRIGRLDDLPTQLFGR